MPPLAPFRPRLLDALRGYDRQRWMADLGAGVTVGIVALPLAMAFAIASGLPPAAGLWTAILAGFLISALGGTQAQIGGPAGAFIVVVYGIVERHGLSSRAHELGHPTEDGRVEIGHRGRTAFSRSTASLQSLWSELTYRMQATAAEVMDISRESKEVLEMYGAKPGAKSTADTRSVGDKPLAAADDPAFANNCLLARRLVESGVRFVQLYDWGWDHHGSSPGESIDETLPIKCQQIDQAVFALLSDLKQRGMLDSTLVIWGGEFGRTPMMQNNVRKELKKGFYGRDHHGEAFTMWLAGGGIKPGLAYGATDDIGYYITEDKTQLRDLKATVLHLLGLDHEHFSFKFQGLNAKLTGVEPSRVLREILA
ncbi:MAG: DUF1501 domain-containing protein [Planctomycetes bacterium]|nr:DUF1501 domain-containing protein [Planctomycetota bacterium]